MERKVKFRGKVVNHDPMTNPENGWVEGYYLQDLDNGEVKHYIFNCPMKWEVIPETIGQFTGIKDNDGKEIYEGDVVTEMGYPFECSNRIVKYDKEYGAYKFLGNEGYVLALDFCDLKVIGNIFDTPNLLHNGRD